MSENIDKNFIEISDLAINLFTKLTKNKKIIFLYKKLIDLLIKIQKIKLKKKYIFIKKELLNLKNILVLSFIKSQTYFLIGIYQIL